MQAQPKGLLRGTDFRDSNGIYEWPPTGEKFRSVTTTLKKGYPKEALVNWGIYAVADGVVAMVTRLEKISKAIKDAKDPSVPAVKEDLRHEREQILADLRDRKVLGQLPYTYRDTKRDIGSRFHDVAEARAYGSDVNPSMYPADVRPYIESYLRWHDREHPEFWAAEAAAFSREHIYAGTFDGFLTVQSRFGVIDYKTSKDTYEDHALQLSAYRHGEFIGLGTGEEVPLPKTEFGAVLVVSPTECQLYEWSCGEDVFRIFLGVHQTASWRETNPKPIPRLP